MKKSAIYIYILIMLLSTNLVIAQNMSDLECGDIRVEELTAENDVHEFDLNVSAGTFLNITIEPIGNSLNPFMTIYDSGLNVILRLNSEPEGQAEQLNDYQISSSTPRIKLFGTRLGYYNYTTEHKGSLGAYTIRIGCTLLNGDVINPGAVAPPTEQPDNIVGDPPPFSGFGFHRSCTS